MSSRCERSFVARCALLRATVGVPFRPLIAVCVDAQANVFLDFSWCSNQDNHLRSTMRLYSVQHFLSAFGLVEKPGVQPGAGDESAALDRSKEPPTTI